MTEDDLGERFIELNANADFMAARLADFLRNCMRAAAASDPSGPVARASEDFRFLLRLLAKSQSASAYELISKAVEDLAVEERGDSLDGAVIYAAQMGMRFLVETSCADNAARGRASRRQTEFLDAIKRIEEAREELRQQYAKRR